MSDLYDPRDGWVARIFITILVTSTVLYFGALGWFICWVVRHA